MKSVKRTNVMYLLNRELSSSMLALSMTESGTKNLFIVIFKMSAYEHANNASDTKIHNKFGLYFILLKYSMSLTETEIFCSS